MQKCWCVQVRLHITVVLCLLWLLCTCPHSHLLGLFLCGGRCFRIWEGSGNFLGFHHPNGGLLQETEWNQTNLPFELVINGGRRGDTLVPKQQERSHTGSSVAITAHRHSSCVHRTLSCQDGKETCNNKPICSSHTHTDGESIIIRGTPGETCCLFSCCGGSVLCCLIQASWAFCIERWRPVYKAEKSC